MSGRGVAVHDVRTHHHAVVGDRGVGRRHLDRRDRLALADRQVAERRAGVLVRVQHDARRLAREVHARRLPEAERPHPLVEADRTEALADLHGTHVRGLSEDLLHLEGDVAPRLGVLDRAVGHLVGRGQVEGRVRRDQPVLERARNGEGLEGGARLVAVRDGAVLLRVGRRAAGVVGVHARPVGERED